MAKSSVRWAFNLHSWNPPEADILYATSCIQHEEKERIQKFVFQNDFKASLIGRLLMRKFVSNATNIPYDALHFERDVHGKPICRELENVQLPVSFNVSHQGHYAVLAGEIGRTHVGVDVMKLEYTGGKPLSEYFRLMGRQFSAHEWQNIKCGSPEAQISSFYRHWCLKESYVKAVGVGITINLQEISFKVNTPQLRVNSVATDTELYIQNRKSPWRFAEELIDSEHVVAVACDSVEGEISNAKFQEVTFAEVLVGCKPILSADLDCSKVYFAKLQRQ